MKTFKRVRSFRYMKGKGYFHFTSGAEKRRMRFVIFDLEKVFIPKKVNEECD